jgi:hypothetical protein
MERIFAVTFILLVFLSGLLCLLMPVRVVAFRKARRWSESMISGGWYYATPERTRVMGVALTFISAVCSYLLLFPWS